MKTPHSDLMEWMTAATGVGVFDFATSPIERRDYDGYQTTKFVLENWHLCYAMTRPNGYTIVGTFDPVREQIRSISLTSIERNAYNERETEEIVREIVTAFIRETGVVRMRVHVAKKVFQSSNKATVAVLVEEIPDNG